MQFNYVHIVSLSLHYMQDDEIDITELDFALKAVNYDLISDAEVDYVNQVSGYTIDVPTNDSLEFHCYRF